MTYIFNLKKKMRFLWVSFFNEVDDKIGVLPSIKDSGREKFHLTKKLYYDYLMVPYKSDLNGAEVMSIWTILDMIVNKITSSPVSLVGHIQEPILKE